MDLNIKRAFVGGTKAQIGGDWVKYLILYYYYGQINLIYTLNIKK